MNDRLVIVQDRFWREKPYTLNAYLKRNAWQKQNGKMQMFIINSTKMWSELAFGLD